MARGESPPAWRLGRAGDDGVDADAGGASSLAQVRVIVATAAFDAPYRPELLSVSDPTVDPVTTIAAPSWRKGSAPCTVRVVQRTLVAKSVSMSCAVTLARASFPRRRR